jgi:hypothetical protein
MRAAFAIQMRDQQERVRESPLTAEEPEPCGTEGQDQAHAFITGALRRNFLMKRGRADHHRGRVDDERRDKWTQHHGDQGERPVAERKPQLLRENSQGTGGQSGGQPIDPCIAGAAEGIDPYFDGYQRTGGQRKGRYTDKSPSQDQRVGRGGILLKQNGGEPDKHHHQRGVGGEQRPADWGGCANGRDPPQIGLRSRLGEDERSQNDCDTEADGPCAPIVHQARESAAAAEKFGVEPDGNQEQLNRDQCPEDRQARGQTQRSSAMNCIDGWN